MFAGIYVGGSSKRSRFLTFEESKAFVQLSFLLFFIFSFLSFFLLSSISSDGAEKLGVFLKGVAVTSPSIEFVLLSILKDTDVDSMTLCHRYRTQRKCWIPVPAVKKAVSMVHDCLYHHCASHPWCVLSPIIYLFIFFLLLLPLSYGLIVSNHFFFFSFSSDALHKQQDRRVLFEESVCPWINAGCLGSHHGR